MEASGGVEVDLLPHFDRGKWGGKILGLPCYCWGRFAHVCFMDFLRLRPCRT